MTNEKRLHDLLERIAPEPPRAIRAESLMHREPARRTVLPILVAAAVVLVAVAATLIVRYSSHPNSTPAAVSPTPTAPAPTQPTPSPRSAPTTRAAVLPWGGRIVLRYGVQPYSLISDGNSLFAYSERGMLVKIDPFAGQVTARQPLGQPSSPVESPVLAADQIWTVTDVDHFAALRSFATANLSARYTLPLGGLRASTDRVLLAAEGSVVYVYADKQVFAYDATSGRLLHEFGFADSIGPSTVGALAVATGRLYLGTVYGAGGGSLITADAGTGAITSSKPQASVIGITVTAGGLWLSTTSGGHTDTTFFTGAPDQVFSSGGGVGPTVTIHGSTAWLGGPEELRCSDANTGRTRARVGLNLDGNGSYVVSVVTARGAVFAAVSNGSAWYPVRLRPPTACL